MQRQVALGNRSWRDLGLRLSYRRKINPSRAVQLGGKIGVRGVEVSIFLPPSRPHPHPEHTRHSWARIHAPTRKRTRHERRFVCGNSFFCAPAAGVVDGKGHTIRRIFALCLVSGNSSGRVLRAHLRKSLRVSFSVPRAHFVARDVLASRAGARPGSLIPLVLAADGLPLLFFFCFHHLLFNSCARVNDPTRHLSSPSARPNACTLFFRLVAIL